MRWDRWLQLETGGSWHVRRESGVCHCLRGGVFIIKPVVPSTVPYAMARDGNDLCSARGQCIPSSFDDATTREERRVLPASGGSGLGLEGMGSVSKCAINVVNHGRAKDADRLAPKGMGSARRVCHPPSWTHSPPANSAAPNPSCDRH
jgi:hypothetical protein